MGEFQHVIVLGTGGYTPERKYHTGAGCSPICGILSVTHTFFLLVLTPVGWLSSGTLHDVKRRSEDLTRFLASNFTEVIIEIQSFWLYSGTILSEAQEFSCLTVEPFKQDAEMLIVSCSTPTRHFGLLMTGLSKSSVLVGILRMMEYEYDHPQFLLDSVIPSHQPTIDGWSPHRWCWNISLNHMK